MVMEFVLNNTNIVLIGFMGSGKSTLGQYIASHTHRTFIDTDTLIEKKIGMTISDYFSSYGESAFRQQEAEVLSSLELMSHCVIATGGGTPCFYPNVKKIGYIIYLHLPFELLLQRLSQEEIAKRPLFQNKEQALTLFTQRESIYQKYADITLNASLPVQENWKKLCALGIS